VDQATEKVGEQIEKSGDDIQDAAKGDKELGLQNVSLRPGAPPVTTREVFYAARVWGGILRVPVFCLAGFPVANTGLSLPED